jgi:hypothetical protein
VLVRERTLNVSLVPGDPARAVGDMLELHLKGTQQRKRIPLAAIADALWPAPIAKEAKRDWYHMTEADIVALEKLFPPQREGA